MDKEILKKITTAIEQVSEEQNLDLEIGTPMTGDEFLNMMSEMKKAYDKSGKWSDTMKPFCDATQKVRRNTHTQESQS